MHATDGKNLSEFYAAFKSGSNAPLSQNSDTIAAEDYFRSLLPLCRIAKITRIADLTGLDRIGVPIIQTVRPAALSEVTSLGRGVSRTNAAIGAIMESLERYYAEKIPLSRVFLSTAETLGVRSGSFDGHRAASADLDWRDRELAWIMGVDVATGDSEPVPFELVHTIYTDPPPPHDGVFFRTTTGLACHRTGVEALFHGLMECIERDAMARAFQSHGFMDRMRMSAMGLGPAVHSVLSTAAEFGVSAAFWYAPSPVGIPVVWCQTIEAGEREPILGLPTEGYCAGLDLQQAALGALLEALAARAGAISGARDDQTRKHYARPSKVVIAEARDMILGDVTALNAADVVLPPFADLAALVERVFAAGLGPIIAVPISTQSDPDVHCVRTVLAGMQAFAIER